MLRRLLSLVALCITLLSKVVYSQDACERIIVDNLGRSDMLGNTGLVASVMAPTGEAGNIVDVRILNMTIVCEAQHMMQDRYRYTSVVVSFNCFTADNRVPECADSSVVNTEQFDFGCVSGAWSRNILSDSTAARTTNPTATLSTGLDTDCIVCINPNNAEAMFLPNPVDSVTHCVGKWYMVGSSWYLIIRSVTDRTFYFRLCQLSHWSPALLLSRGDYCH